MKEFKIKELGKLKYFLDIEVAHSWEGIFISQQKYITDLLMETGKLGCRPAEMPIEFNHRLGDTLEDSSISRLLSETCGETRLLVTH